MASAARRRRENVAGDFFVDSTCIDCDTCRWMAPETFTDAGDQSAVHRQPRSEPERRRALQALVACPTGSIGTIDKPAIAPVLASFPLPVTSGEARLDDVYHSGFHAESSFGATSYLIVRREGNVLVDSPRYAGALVRRLEELGGVRSMFLTHRDDVADHARYRAHFGCERVLHRGDAVGELESVERIVEGDAPVALDDDLLVIPTPGHTRGSACLLYRGNVLFTGDHLAWSDARADLTAFRDACWFDWGVQTASMRRLAEHRFEWVLPGHGRRCHLPRDEMAQRMAALVGRMQR
jgi:glyoxylase-like metal-dependent hydrolase (beta-lactamase superfamily II)/ferredoxin